MKVTATLTVNGTNYPVELDPHVSLLKAVREEVGLTGSKEGCDDSECGACMMLLDGKPVNACSYLALQAEGREVTTVEGLAGDEELGAAAARVPPAGRRPVRVLHAGHARLGDGAAARQPRRRPRRRSGSGCRATCAAAPATTASCARCNRRPRATSRRSGHLRTTPTPRRRTTPAERATRRAEPAARSRSDRPASRRLPPSRSAP